MRTLVPLSAGLLGGLTLVVGSVVSGINAQPGATIRVAQSLGIDAALGPAQRIQAPSGPLYAWEHGPSGGPEVVLVHGFGDAGAGWVPTAMILGKTHHVRMLDLPGHGRSAPHGAALTMEQLESGLSAVMDETEGKVVLVGNSLGGWLSARYALAHPDRVDHLVLVNNAGLSQPIPRDLLLPQTMARQVEKNRAILGEHTVELPGFALRGLLQLNDDPRLHMLFDELQEGGHNLDGRLEDLEVPVTLVWGTPDPFFPADSYLPRMQQALPNARTVVLSGCGHAPQYTCETDVAGAILTASE